MIVVLKFFTDWNPFANAQKNLEINIIIALFAHKITIPTELIGSLPRSAEVVEAQRAHKDGKLTAAQLAALQEKDVRRVLVELEVTGSPQLTDGEQMKPSFLTYPVSVFSFFFSYLMIS